MIRRLLPIIALPLSLLTVQAADPQIQNVTASQRPGTYLVDITYDLIDPDSPTVYIFAEISVNGGSTYTLPGFPATGDLGQVIPGTTKRIVWNAWDNWAGNFTETAKIRLTAVETQTIVPDPGIPAPSPRMTWIPPGTFRNGGRNVWITQGFWIGKYEVTQSEFESVSGFNPSASRGPDRPVENLLWSEVATYCQSLTNLERTAGRLPANWEYRLPTEAQWELACRGGVDGDYFFGASPAATTISAFAWFNYTASHQNVGQKAPNPYSLYDVYGNVWDWCLDGLLDQFNPSAGLPDGNYTDPYIPGAGPYMIMRGGSWAENSAYVSSVARSYRSTISRNPNVGFRVVAVSMP